MGCTNGKGDMILTSSVPSSPESAVAQWNCFGPLAVFEPLCALSYEIPSLTVAPQTTNMRYEETRIQSWNLSYVGRRQRRPHCGIVFFFGLSKWFNQLHKVLADYNKLEWLWSFLKNRIQSIYIILKKAGKKKKLTNEAIITLEDFTLQKEKGLCGSYLWQNKSNLQA